MFSDNQQKMETQNSKECENLENVIDQDFGEDSGFIDVSCTVVNSFLFLFIHTPSSTFLAFIKAGLF